MEGITAGLSATNNRGKKGKLLATVQLVNDLGEEIAKGGMKAPAEVSAGRKADVFEFSTDAFEEGGYYQLRAHAAQLADDGAEDTAMEIIYLKVDAGKLVPLTVNEYYANSLANLGVQK